MSPRPKGSVQHGAAFAKGGKTKMFGKQAAGPDRPGNTGKDQSAAPGAKAAKGGPHLSRSAVSLLAKAGRTAPPTKGR
jgi:hypothetical protein